MPKVSVIVPVYNKEKYIGRCIESIQNQSMTDWELILVDDCSTDKSIHIMNDYASRDDRIIVRRQEENHGPMMARRLGDEIAKGDYITYCDADDTLPKMALQNLYDEVIRTGADIVSGNYDYYRTDGTKMRTAFSLEYGNDTESILKSLLKKQIVHSLWSKLYRRSLLRDYNYEVIDHMTNAEDAYMFYQIMLNIHKMVQIPSVVYNYMQTPGSSTQKKYSEKVLDDICLLNSMRIKYISFFPTLKPEIIAYVSDVLVSLMYDAKCDRNVLKRLLIKYDMLKYYSNKTIFQYHSIIKALKLLVKKIILSINY
jgi:glycosyltransferase involved in cell wall biosynthesis